MRQTFLSKTILSQATPVLGAVALSAIALVGMPQSAKAGALACGSVDGSVSNWVNSCPSGTDSFNSKATLNIDFFGLVPPKKVNLSGPTTIFRGAGSGGTIQTEIVNFKLTGDGLTVIAGDGKGDLAGDMHSLTSLGAITEQALGSPLAKSFFDVFAEIEGTPFGPLRNKDPLHLEAVIPGVPPLQSLIPDFKGYILQADVDLFNPGNDGIFWTADDELVAQIVRGNPNSDDFSHHVPTDPIPEPSTAAASIFVGLGAIFGLKRKQQSNKS